MISKLEIISSKLKHINLGTTCAKNIKLTGAPLLPLTSKDGLASLITWLGIDKNSDLMVPENFNAYFIYYAYAGYDLIYLLTTDRLSKSTRRRKCFCSNRKHSF